MSFVRSLVEFERLWIFKVVRWTCNRCTKINKSPTASNGIRASSFEIWTANLAQSLTVGTLTNSRSFIFGVSSWKLCEVGYPVGTPKPDIQMQIFLILDWLIFSCVKKIKTCWVYKNTIRKLRKTRSVPKRLFGCYYWFLKWSSGISFDTVTSLHMGFHSERAAAGLGPSGLDVLPFKFHYSCCHCFFLLFFSSADARLLEESTSLIARNFAINNCHTGNLRALVHNFMIRATELKASAQCEEWVLCDRA